MGWRRATPKSRPAMADKDPLPQQGARSVITIQTEGEINE
jgi:hypothetical protein